VFQSHDGDRRIRFQAINSGRRQAAARGTLPVPRDTLAPRPFDDGGPQIMVNGVMLIEDTVRGWLADGTLGPGDALPKEREFVERFSMARTSIRAALGKLIDEGLLVVDPGPPPMTRVAERPVSA
jgi:hypothetical protein